MVCDFVTSELFALAVVGAGVLHENFHFWSESHDRWFRDNLDVAVSRWSRRQNNLKKEQENINNKVPDEPLLDFICTVLPQES